MAGPVHGSGAWQMMALIERGEQNEAVGDDGYRRIRSDVIFGRLRPGQKLKLDAYLDLMERLEGAPQPG